MVSHPELLAEVGRAYVPLLRRLAFDRLAALPYAALPIGTAVSLAGGWPMIYPRREVKGYGTGATIEGAYRPGERVVVIDDLATTGGSKFEAIDKLTEAGLAVEDVVVLIDRESGAGEALSAAGYRLHAVVRLSELLDYWEATARCLRNRSRRRASLSHGSAWTGTNSTQMTQIGLICMMLIHTCESVPSASSALNSSEEIDTCIVRCAR